MNTPQATQWDLPARVAALVHTVLTLTLTMTVHAEWIANPPAAHLRLLIVACAFFLLRPIWRAGLLRKSVSEIHRSVPGRALLQTWPFRQLVGMCLVIGVLCEFVRWFGP